MADAWAHLSNTSDRQLEREMDRLERAVGLIGEERGRGLVNLFGGISGNGPFGIFNMAVNYVNFTNLF